MSFSTINPFGFSADHYRESCRQLHEEITCANDNIAQEGSIFNYIIWQRQLQLLETKVRQFELLVSCDQMEEIFRRALKTKIDSFCVGLYNLHVRINTLTPTSVHQISRSTELTIPATRETPQWLQELNETLSSRFW